MGVEALEARVLLASSLVLLDGVGGDNGTFQITASDLPPHTHLSVSWEWGMMAEPRVSGGGPDITTSIKLDDQVLLLERYFDWQDPFNSSEWSAYGYEKYQRPGVQAQAYPGEVGGHWYFATYTTPHIADCVTMTFTVGGMLTHDAATWNGPEWWSTGVRISVSWPEVEIGSYYNLAAEDPAPDDPEGGPQPATLWVERRGAPLDVPLTLNLDYEWSATDQLPAADPTDLRHDGQPWTVTIPAGQSSMKFDVIPSDDSEIERTETFRVNIAPPADGGAFYQIIPPINTWYNRVFILDNDWEIAAFRMRFHGDQLLKHDDGTFLNSRNHANGWHWIDGNADGDAEGGEQVVQTRAMDHPETWHENAIPASYVRTRGGNASLLKVDIDMRIEGVLTGNWVLEGSTSAFGGMQWHLAGDGRLFQGNTLTPLNGKALPDVIDWSEVKIDWKVTRTPAKNPGVAGEGPETTAEYTQGASGRKNVVYVTGAPAPGAYHTVVHLGATSGARGASPDTQQGRRNIIDGIWEVFAGRSVKRMSDDAELRYNHAGVVGFNYQDMLKSRDGDGQCTAWSTFLLAACQVHGVDGSRVRMRNPDENRSFLVNRMAAQGTGGAFYGVREFGFHEIVYFDDHANRLYDPSYGGGPAEAERGLPANVIYENLNLDSLQYMHNGVILEQRNTVDVLDLHWTLFR